MSNSNPNAGNESLWQRVRGSVSGRRGAAEDVEVDERRSIVEPVIILVIGMALALYDQTASEVSGVLRVPALVAGLILFGQGLTDLRAAQKKNAARRAGVNEPATVGAPATEPVRVGAGTEAAAPVNRGVDPEASEDNGAGTLPWLVIGLAVWLGLATLAFPTAPLPLILLSLLSSFLLFARGWGMVTASRQRGSEGTTA